MRDTHGWRRALLGAALLTCLAAVACAVELGTTARTPGFLEVEWDGATTDTIDALIDGVVIAQVRDLDGRPMSSRFIRFTALPLGDDNRPGVFLAPLGLTPTQPTTQVTANTAGIAIAAVRLGTLPGRAISLAGETVTGAALGTGQVFGVSGEVTDSVAVEVAAPAGGGA